MKFYVNMTSVCGPGYQFQSVVWGLHIYKEIWTTVINEKLDLSRKKTTTNMIVVLCQLFGIILVMKLKMKLKSVALLS